jgi:hypothetical protein
VPFFYAAKDMMPVAKQPFTSFLHLKNMIVFNPARFFVFAFFALLLSANARAQYSYVGRTSELSSGYPIGDVNISHKRWGTTIVSDRNGAFSWDFDTSDKTQHYRIVYNLFFAPDNTNVSLQLLTSDGKILIKTPTIGAGETYLLPKLKPGVYILQVLSDAKIEVLKLFSSGELITILQNQETQKSSNSNDTLLFSKDGYYSVEIPFPKKDTVAHVKLLSKTDNDLNYLNGLPNYQAFDILQSSPFVTNQGEVESLKFIYNQHDNRVYYMNSKRFEFHYPFAEQFLDYDKGHYHFNMTQYTNSGERFLYPGSINYYKALDKYVLRFYAGDKINCSQIRHIFDRITSTSYLQGKLYLYPNNPEWENCSEVPVITSDELYEGQNYQALNLASGYGYLRKIDIKHLNSNYLGKHDIIVLNGIPNDVSVVSGIITTEFQTPLSHINILSHNRGTPNMALRNAWSHPKLEELLGELVYLEVQADSFIIRKATLDEATAFWSQNEPQTIVSLEKDTNTSGLIDLKQAGYSSVNVIGGKAANFAELLKLKNPTIATPENPFAIPFYYYNQHMVNNQIDLFMKELFEDDAFKTNQEYRKQKLEELRTKITEAQLNPVLTELVRTKIEHFKDFDAWRFRSSTNAEDLEFFSGAGLYDSYSAKKDDENKTIENAIKKVWASCWNFRAFEEREYYKIEQNSVAMGILVHRSFPNENANGVVITKNLYNINPGFIVNVQFDEYSIVFPEPGILHDQLILYTYSLDPSHKFTIEYLSHSNIPGYSGQNVLTNDELYQLGEYCMQIKSHFFNNLPHSCNCLFDDFGLDIEFKIDSPNNKRKLYIKQVRLYH